MLISEKKKKHVCVTSLKMGKSMRYVNVDRYLREGKEMVNSKSDM